jgi:GNAT superfamily N-acetyltransferase
VILAYVDRIDLGHDAVFGIRDAGHALVGVVHVAMDGDCAELGLSVLAGHRRRGVAEVLFNRAVTHARNRSVAEILMHCAADNAPILQLARKFGMRFTLRGGEVAARLGLQPAFTVPIARGFTALSLAA